MPRKLPNDMIAYATFPDSLSIIRSWIEPRLFRSLHLIGGVRFDVGPPSTWSG